MFLARRPSQLAIDRFLRDSQDLPLSYGPIGIVRGETARHDPNGFYHGISVKHQGKTAVLTGPPLTFVPPQIPGTNERTAPTQNINQLVH